jgi:hypothetical protein
MPPTSRTATAASWRWPALVDRYPFLMKLYADGGYQGPAFQDALGKIL